MSILAVLLHLAEDAQRRDFTKAAAASRKEGRLVLWLMKAPFDVMVTREKKLEFRLASEFWRKRLLKFDGTPKKFDIIEFRNGFGEQRPKFRVKHIATHIIRSFSHTYSNGMAIDFEGQEHIALELGDIEWTANVK
jgi:hypothetical protein